MKDIIEEYVLFAEDYDDNIWDINFNAFKEIKTFLHALFD